MGSQRVRHSWATKHRAQCVYVNLSIPVLPIRMCSSFLKFISAQKERKKKKQTENRVRFLIWALGKCWGKWRKFPVLVYCSPPLSLAGWTGITSLENPLPLPGLWMPMALPPCPVAEKSKHQAWGPSLCIAPQPMGKLNILNAPFSWSPFYFSVVSTFYQKQ